MANKYEKEISMDKKTRDKLITKRIGAIFDVIRDKSQILAMEVSIKAGDNTEYFQERNRSEKFAIKTNETLRPEYLKKDKFSKDRYIEEYRTAYLESLYTVVNTGIKDGYLVKLPRYTKEQFKKAINYPLSKLMNNIKMKSARSIDIEQIYTSIVSGIEQGLSLKNINKQIDINLGYRDAQTGKWIADISQRKGQTYKTQRVLRTEILRMRSTAETDQYLNQQPIVESKLQLIEVLDNRTRSQSANMDGQIANSEGKFLFPNGQYAYAHRSGVAKWDINDRSTTITLDPEYPQERRIQRDPKTGKNKVVPFEDFKSYADKNGLVKNRYGEYLYGKPGKKNVSTPKPSSKKIIKDSVKRNVKPISKPRETIRDVDKLSFDAEKLALKKSGYSMKITENIANEFNVTRDRVLNVEAAYTKKFPRRKLNIDQLRSLVVEDMSQEIKRLRALLK